MNLQNNNKKRLHILKNKGCAIEFQRGDPYDWNTHIKVLFRECNEGLGQIDGLF